MLTLEEALVLAFYAGTALSAAFNAGYFATYRAGEPRRRVGAVVLALVSLGLLVERAYFGLALLFQGSAGPLSLEAGPWLLAGLLAGLSSLLITFLILRQTLSHRKES